MIRPKVFEVYIGLPPSYGDAILQHGLSRIMAAACRSSGSDTAYSIGVRAE